MVESKKFRWFRVISFDAETNFAKTFVFEDNLPDEILGKPSSEFMDEFLEAEDEKTDSEDDSAKQIKDLMTSEIHDLKSTWFVFNKKM